MSESGNEHSVILRKLLDEMTRSGADVQRLAGEAERYGLKLEDVEEALRAIMTNRAVEAVQIESRNNAIEELKVEVFKGSGSNQPLKARMTNVERDLADLKEKAKESKADKKVIVATIVGWVFAIAMALVGYFTK